MNGHRLFGLFVYGFIFLVSYMFVTVVYQDCVNHGAVNWAAVVAAVIGFILCWRCLRAPLARRILTTFASLVIMVELLAVNEGLSIGYLQPWLVVLLPTTVAITFFLLWRTLDTPPPTKRRRTHLGAFPLD